MIHFTDVTLIQILFNEKIIVSLIVLKVYIVEFKQRKVNTGNGLLYTKLLIRY